VFRKEGGNLGGFLESGGVVVRVVVFGRWGAVVVRGWFGFGAIPVSTFYSSFPTGP